MSPILVAPKENLPFNETDADAVIYYRQDDKEWPIWVSYCKQGDAGFFLMGDVARFHSWKECEEWIRKTLVMKVVNKV